VFQQLYSKVKDFIQQINSTTRSTQGLHNKGSDLRLCIDSIKTGFTAMVLSGLEPFRGSERAAKRRARSVALVIGITLCFPMGHADGGSIDAIQSIKQLADKQLTEKQEYCHNQIVFRESSFRNDASNGSHHGYYQGKSKVLDGAPDDYQFYWFYHYTMHRYGLDPNNEDMPNYCKSLNHLVTKGWQ